MRKTGKHAGLCRWIMAVAAIGLIPAASQDVSAASRDVLAASQVVSAASQSQVVLAASRDVSAEPLDGPHRRDAGNDRPFAPFAFVQAGDPQMGFGPDLKHDREMFTKLGRRAKELGAAFVLVCGDLVHEGRTQDWQAFNRALLTFTMPTKLVPGNHDLSDMRSLRRYRAGYGKDYHSFTHNNCTFIGLNAMTMVGPPPGKDAPKQSPQWQEESRKQWQWLDETLARAKQARRTHIVLFLHHPPFVTKENEKDAYYNWPGPTRRRLLRLLRRYGVKVILNGHTHKTYTVKSVDKAFTIHSLAGTAKLFDKNGFCLRIFHVETDRIEAKLIRLDTP